MLSAPAIQTYALATKPDAAASFARYEAWWRQELTDRPPVCMAVQDERPIAMPASPVYADQRSRWFDLEHRLACHAAWVDGHAWLADDLPTFMPNLGPDILATRYGAELEFGPDTSWSKPIVADCTAVPGLARRDDVYSRWIEAATTRSLELGKGRWLTAITDLHSNGDLLAALRDPQHLLEEMADDPAAVQAAMEHLTPHYEDFWRCAGDRIRAAGQPTLSWLPAPHFGRSCVIQCDLICMMSSRMFKRFILPALQWEMRFLERSIFHLDGPGALVHLDALLACPELHAVQWVYGASNGPARKWTEVYQRIQAAGKSMQILCEDIADARALMQVLKPQGTWFCLGGSHPRDQVLRFLDEAQAWSDRTR